MDEMDIARKLKRAVEIHLDLEKVKPLYKELDEITLDLVKTGKTDFESLGIKCQIVDNFLDKNTCYRMAFVKRFELKIGPANGKNNP